MLTQIKRAPVTARLMIHRRSWDADGGARQVQPMIVFIVVGRGPMPERSFAPSDAEALVTYLESLEPASSSPPPASKP